MRLEFVVDEDASDRDCALAFISWLEAMGARFAWRDDRRCEWQLALDGIRGLTRDEAAAIAREALDHSHEIREVLRDRWPVGGVIH